MKLTTKLTLIFLLLAIIPLVAVGWLAFESGRRAIEQDTIDRLLTTTILKQAQFEQWIDDRQADVRAFAGRPQLRRYSAILAASGADTPEYAAAYTAIHRDYFTPLLAEQTGGVVDYLLIRARDGLILTSTDITVEGKYRESEPYFIEGLKGTFVSDIYYAVTLGRQVMHVSTPVYDDYGNVVAVLAARINLTQLTDMMARSSGLRESEATYLVNKFGFRVTEKLYDPDSHLRTIVNTEGVNDCLAQHDDVRTYADGQGEPVVGAYRWIAAREVCIITEIKAAEAFGPISALRNTILGFGVVIALGAIGLGLVFARTITTPLQRLATGAEEIGRGNLAYRIEAKGRDEIGALATAFNAMAANLGRAQEDIAYRQRMLLALSQAAIAVQRAHTPDAVYRVLGAEIGKLGWNVMVFSLVDAGAIDAGAQLVIDYHSFATSAPATAEHAAAGAVMGHRFAIQPGSLYDRVIHAGVTIFSDQPAEGMRQVLSEQLRPLVDDLTRDMGIRGSIYAPLGLGDSVSGVLMVTGADLTEADIPAIATFARQAASARENARLWDDIQRAADRLEQLVDIRTAALAGSEERFRSLAQSSPVGIFVADEKDNLHYANERLCAICGLPAEAAKGIGWIDAVHPADRDRVLDDWRRSTEAGEDFRSEYRFLHQHGKVIWALGQAAIMRDDQGATTGYVGTITDISQIKLADLALQKANDDLARSNTELEQFAYVASHDLQEPLRMVTSYLQLLERRYKGNLDDDAHEFIAYAVDGATRMKALINDLLSFSRVGTRGQPFELTDVQRVVDGALANLQIAMEESGAQVTCGALPTVMGDPSQLTQVFQNLIGNAIKFHGEQPPVVRIAAERQDDAWLFTVCDNGIGIEAAYFDRIFIIFQRLHGKQEYPGTGIGLALSRKVIQRHGGRLWVESQSGAGSTFYFTIPDGSRNSDEAN